MNSFVQYLHDEGWKKRQLVFSYTYLLMLKYTTLRAFVIITARKRSLRRYVFTGVCLSTGGRGFCPIACWDIPPGTRGRHPPGRHPPEQTPPWETPPGPEADTLPGRHPLCSACWDMVNKRAVHIPLECILVSSIELLLPREHTCVKT